LRFPHANLASGGHVVVNRGRYGLTVSFPARMGMVDKWEGYIYQPDHPPAEGDEDSAFGSIVGRVSSLGGGWYYVWFG
jgi:hypothetical protein